MPETEEEILSIIHEFDDRVRDMEIMLDKIYQKRVFKDQITSMLIYTYWLTLLRLETGYTLIDNRQSILTRRREL